MRRTPILTAAVAAAVLVTAGCRPSQPGGPADAHASTLATSSAARTAENYLKPCVPASGPGQVKLARSLTTGTPVSRKTARDRLAGCLGVPASERPAWEAALLTAAGHANWATPAGRRQFFTVTIVTITTRYRAGGS